MPRGTAHTASIESNRLGSEVSKRSGQNLYSTGFGLLNVSRGLAGSQINHKGHQGARRKSWRRKPACNVVSREFRTTRFVEPKGSMEQIRGNKNGLSGRKRKTNAREARMAPNRSAACLRRFFRFRSAVGPLTHSHIPLPCPKEFQAPWQSSAAL